MDPRVIDAPWPIRAGIVHLAVLPSRPHESAKAYQKIWLDEGSPLIVLSQKVAAALRKQIDCPVELAMRYQSPSIDCAIANLIAEGVEHLLVVPLFPHYAMSSFETAMVRVQKEAAKQAPGLVVQIMEPFYNDPRYIEALVDSASPYLAGPFDHLLFSFHGLPERHLRKADTTGCHCLKTKNCCQVPSSAHKTCYRAQCFRTVEAFVDQENLSAAKYSVAFQSRLGRDPWLQPYTDRELVLLAGRGIRKLLVMCPAFICDCLETLEEIAIRGRETFREAGGDDLTLIPCLNDHPRWISALAAMTNDCFRPREAGRKQISGLTVG